MLVDCEMMGAGRRFALRVPDVEQAWSFYRDIMGAQEIFRNEAAVGGPRSIGFTIGKAGFMLTSQADTETGDGPPTLVLLAKEFGVSFAAIVLYVRDPNTAAQRALEAGSQLRSEAASMPSCRDHPVEVIVDPFGHSWAFAKSSEEHVQ
jgi:uncharacterized glyoxalase superfamily protein PhnB